MTNINLAQLLVVMGVVASIFTWISALINKEKKLEFSIKEVSSKAEFSIREINSRLDIFENKYQDKVDFYDYMFNAYKEALEHKTKRLRQEIKDIDNKIEAELQQKNE